MKRLESEYSEEGLKVLWIGFQDQAENIRGFAGRHGMERVGFDQHNTLSKKFGVSYGAGLVFIDASGTVRHRVAKGFTEAALREGIERIINTPASPSQTQTQTQTQEAQAE